MIKVVYTRPHAWLKYPSGDLDLHYVSVGQPNPQLKSGVPAGDEMGEVCTKRGAKELIRAFEEHKPDVFLFWVHFGEFNQSLLQKLRGISPSTMFVHGNGNQVLHRKYRVCWYVHAMRKWIDLVVTNLRDPDRWRLLRKWVPAVDTLYTYGFDPDLFSEPTGEPAFDCFFGGGNSVVPGRPYGRFDYSRFRYELVSTIRKVGYSIRVRGRGWGYFAKSGIRGLSYFQDMQRARIVLGTYHEDFYRYYTKRTIYGGASGRVFMTRYIPGMEHDFVNHKNIVWYHNMAEALDLIDRYTRVRTKEAEELGKDTRDHFVKHHSWEVRLREFEEICKRHLAGRSK